MSVTEGQRHYLQSTLAWLLVLQACMFGYLVYSPLTVCNSLTAWPLQFTGSFLLTGIVTLLVVGFAWKKLAEKKTWPEMIGLAIFTAVGISHTLERVSSGCVLDYWLLPIPDTPIFVNLGDVSLFIGVVILVYWYTIGSKK
jgi:lipoprotein signal peptidase